MKLVIISYLEQTLLGLLHDIQSHVGPLAGDIHESALIHGKRILAAGGKSRPTRPRLPEPSSSSKIPSSIQNHPARGGGYRVGREINMNTRPGRHPPLHKERLEWRKVPSDSARSRVVGVSQCRPPEGDIIAWLEGCENILSACYDLAVA